ncbi:AGAP011909-PA-like protein [Anopheles sinensis]|uniref:AGAP011909-PA-like protein n=1 Tax=Anopheles sinensis TaxID=74873 RepID=A0A084WIL5_ANOSI|nr:AGAP011909-PA-like protein [Anopheles sinensis]
MLPPRKRNRNSQKDPPGTVLLLVCTTLTPALIVQAQYSGCDYSIDVASGQSYSIYSPYYSGFYPAYTQCRWTLNTTPGSRIALYCSDISLPTSNGCSTDKLIISTGGQSNLSDGNTYCGAGVLNTESSSNKMVIALQVPGTTNGGRFYCTATKIDCQCGMRKRKKIVNGEETLVNEFPMMAALVDGSSGEGIFCGATIVTNYHAITAAHCFMGRSIGSLALLVGEHDITTGADSPYTALLLLASVKIHESYNPTTRNNDIAIVRTRTEISFNAGVGPACLPLKYDGASFVGITLEAVGWGTLDYGAPKSNVPMKVGLAVVAPAQCTAVYPNFSTTQQLCVLTANKDTCQSDSGGPLFYTDAYNQRVYLLGTIGYGIACASDNPSVNTKVLNYMQWIMSNTPEWNYCYQ